MTQPKNPSKYTKAAKRTVKKTIDIAPSYALKRIQQTAFLMSAPTFRLCTEDEGFEVAFAGRSNAGKSSAINALTNQKQLARSSKTPGRTQMINFFTIGDESTRLVDLPGYGYAAVPKEMKIKWQIELEEYLVERDSLKCLVLLTDIRHPLKFYDERMLHWAKDGDLPVHILLTKADKLKYGAARTALMQTKKVLKEQGLTCTIQLFSALNKDGIEELSEVLASWLEIDEEKDKAKAILRAIKAAEEAEEALAIQAIEDGNMTVITETVVKKADNILEQPKVLEQTAEIPVNDTADQPLK